MAAHLSLGIRFHPTDDECMSYLLHAVTGDPIPGISSTADLFGEKEPWEFFSGEEIQERYFYTRLKRVSKNNNNNSSKSTLSKVGSYHRYCRNIGKGTWSNKGQKIPIHGDRGSLLGHKRSFRYESRKGGSVGEWTLKEYSLPDHKLGHVKPEFKDYVLCLLKRRKEKNKKKNGHDSVPAVEADLPYLLSTLVNRRETETSTEQQQLDDHAQGGSSDLVDQSQIYSDNYLRQNSGPVHGDLAYSLSTPGDQSSHTRQLDDHVQGGSSDMVDESLIYCDNYLRQNSDPVQGDLAYLMSALGDQSSHTRHHVQEGSSDLVDESQICCDDYLIQNSGPIQGDLAYSLSALGDQSSHTRQLDDHVQGGSSDLVDESQICCDDYLRQNSGPIQGDLAYSPSALGDQSSHTRQLQGYFGHADLSYLMSTLGDQTQLCCDVNMQASNNDWMTSSNVGLLDDTDFGALDHWLRHCAAA
ncbi:Unknown protein [Striga hermonthica]|uniref:NAC domain-containing protein n=1 Tax=Striga hermonthica TaxID=68872 RepID=A0A9N7RHS1_STRHE|nr:Unknown protein [Striga hermonthica]